MIDDAHQDAIRLAERIRSAVEISLHAFGRNAIDLTVSVGVAIADEERSDLSALMDTADKALYRAKTLGRNRVEPPPHWVEQRSAKQRPAPEKAFAKVLRELRTKRGISQEKLGFDSGYHRTYIGMLERGLMNPTLRTILSIASALGIPAGEFVALVEDAVVRPYRHEAERRRDT